MSELPETVSVQEQAMTAGATVGEADPLDDLLRHCARIIEQTGKNVENRAQAKTKLAEMIYWLRAK